jgi:hypothetical protein
MTIPGNVTESRIINGGCFVVKTLDPAVNTFLTGLNGAAADLDIVADNLALWAVAVEEDEFGADGTAFIVSQEAHKRVQTHRY